MAVTSHFSHSPLLSSIQSQNPEPFSPLSLTHHRKPMRANPSSSISRRRRTLSWIQASNKTQNPISREPFSCIQASNYTQNPISRRPISQVPDKTQNPIFTLLKMPLIIAITAAALISPFKPSLALAAAHMPPVETRSENVEADAEDEERERVLEEYLGKYPDDVKALRVLMGDRIKRDDIRGAIDLVNRLIEIEKDELEWLVLRANLYVMLDEYGVAMEGYEQVLQKEPFRMQAFNGMIVAAKRMDNETEGGDELGKVMRRIEEAMERCRREKRMGMLRDFKLLIAQFRMIEVKYEEALKIYSELAKEEPRDFRPYLCQGMLYTLWGKKNEAKKSYEKYRRLMPRTHPYAKYYDESMTATKVLAEVMERERQNQS
ncbi:hypothetical protein Droror1_Dr00008710 [Drosera rotundifolia]